MVVGGEGLTPAVPAHNYTHPDDNGASLTSPDGRPKYGGDM